METLSPKYSTNNGSLFIILALFPRTLVVPAWCQIWFFSHKATCGQLSTHNSSHVPLHRAEVLLCSLLQNWQFSDWCLNWKRRAGQKQTSWHALCNTRELGCPSGHQIIILLLLLFHNIHFLEQGCLIANGQSLPSQPIPPYAHWCNLASMTCPSSERLGKKSKMKHIFLLS